LGFHLNILLLRMLHRHLTPLHLKSIDRLDAGIHGILNSTHLLVYWSLWIRRNILPLALDLNPWWHLTSRNILLDSWILHHLRLQLTLLKLLLLLLHLSGLKGLLFL